MSSPESSSPQVTYTRALVLSTLSVAAWFMLVTSLLWWLGIESIYGHFTPLYAMIHPSFTYSAVPAAAGLLWLVAIYAWLARGGMDVRMRLAFSLGAGILAGLAFFSLFAAAAETPAGEVMAQVWTELRWHLIPGAVFSAGFIAISRAWPRLSESPGRNETVWILVSLFVFAVLFSLSVAAIHGGAEGITQTYDRYTYEYIGDIGKTRTIQQFFERYAEIHPHLTMHSKVHPPGPVVLLWVLSYGFTQSAMGLSVATVLVGSSAVIPMYFWARDLGGARAGLVAACLYTLTPAITLFAAVSADIMFMPFTLTTLWLFWRALDRGGFVYPLLAGLGYALMSLLSFSLLSIGAFFAFTGLWRLADPERRKHVFITAAIMIAVLLGVHGAVRAWSGFDVIEVFELSKAQFDEDQAQLDELQPRFPGWTFRILNPLAWFFYAGFPVSLLCIRGLRASGRPAVPKPLAVIVLLTLIALDLLYLGRGEAERSALYIFPFIMLPAGLYLAQECYARRSYAPFLAVTILLALQTWAIETWLYTYW